jgi:hypothetical protein
VSLVAKQQRVRARSIATRSDVGPILTPKAPVVAPTTSRINKVVPEDSLENLIKAFKELKVELTALRRNQGPSTSRPVEGSKVYVMRCIWCDDPNHRRSDCG